MLGAGLMGDAFVLAQLRTPRGKGSSRGALAGVAPTELVRQLLVALGERGLAPDAVDDVVLGCASQLDAQGGNLARAAALAAGFAPRAGGTMVNRFCASGLEAIAMAAARVRCGDAQVVIAGGVESVSQVPLFADRGPWWQAGVGRLHMGVAADLAATLDGTTRAELDAYAASTRARARAAAAAGRLAAWTLPVRAADGTVTLAHDELGDYAPTAAELAALPPAFAALGADGQDALALAHVPGQMAIRHDHTRATSPPLADAAAVLVIGDRAAADRLGLTPLARVVTAASVGADPVAMLTAGQDAIVHALARAQLTVDDLAVVEFAEAFAALCVRLGRQLCLGADRLNPDGGTLALGHAFGATGAILAGNVVAHLARTGGRYGVAAVSGAAGVGSAVVLERC
ncbi:MAG: acetyl-CoA C-acyltransferase [Kofleriaceae bacterium]